MPWSFPSKTGLLTYQGPLATTCQILQYFAGFFQLFVEIEGYFIVCNLSAMDGCLHGTLLESSFFSSLPKFGRNWHDVSPRQIYHPGIRSRVLGRIGKILLNL
jgi:hypothetical protein